MKNLMLSRDEAELLDTLLLELAKSGDWPTSHNIGNIAAQLCESWGMSYWHHRDNSGVTKEQWEKLVQFTEFGHREKSLLR